MSRYIDYYFDILINLTDVNDIKDAIREDTILISVMHANNEIGTIQPIVEVGKIAKENDIMTAYDPNYTSCFMNSTDTREYTTLIEFFQP